MLGSLEAPILQGFAGSSLWEWAGFPGQPEATEVCDPDILTPVQSCQHPRRRFFLSSHFTTGLDSRAMQSLGERRIWPLISRDGMAFDHILWIILPQTSWMSGLSPLKWSVHCSSIILISQLTCHRWFNNLSVWTEIFVFSGTLCLNQREAAGAFEMFECCGDGAWGAWVDDWSATCVRVCPPACQLPGAANFNFAVDSEGKTEASENFFLSWRTQGYFALGTQVYLPGLLLFHCNLDLNGKVILAWVEIGGAWEMFSTHRRTGFLEKLLVNHQGLNLILGIKLNMNPWRTNGINSTYSSVLISWLDILKSFEMLCIPQQGMWKKEETLGLRETRSGQVRSNVPVLAVYPPFITSCFFSSPASWEGTSPITLHLQSYWVV